MATLHHPTAIGAFTDTRTDLPARPAPAPAPLSAAEAPLDWPLPARLAWCAAFRRALAAHAGELEAMMRDELGKPAWEAFSADILPVLTACRWAERRAPRLLAPRVAPGRPAWLPGVGARVHRAPLGRVAIIATWNYPVQLLGIQLVHALVAGNRVVVKPSERSPRTQRRLLDIAALAGLPGGALEARDHAREAGQRMLEDERFDHIVFTGSTRVGRCIARHAAETLTPTTLELSGADSALVLPDADPALAARVIFHAATMNAGQTCMAPRRVLVHERVYAPFLAAIAPLAAAARPHDLIDADAAAHATALVRATLDAGARDLTGVVEPARGRSMRPAVLADCPPDAPLATLEHFGPALALVPCASLADMLTAHALAPQRLATAVFTADPAAAERLAPRLGSSIVTVNDCVVSAAHPALPLAGRGDSGWGVTRGDDGLLAMTRPVAVARTPRRLRTPPETPPPALAARLRSLLLWWYGRGGPAPRPATNPGHAAP